MVKAQNIAQYKILTHIKENFFVEELKRIVLAGPNEVLITDKDGDSATFYYDEETGKILMSL